MLLRNVKNGLTRMPGPLRDGVGRTLFRGYETYVAARQAIKEGPVVDHGLPVPPPKLRVKVIGVADVDVFLNSGRLHNELLRQTLARAGVAIARSDQPNGRQRSLEVPRLLDWGCGCGRIMRWWDDLPDGHVAGCDYNPALVQWVRENLPFASAAVNQLTPPLPYQDGSFDFIYAISVFTHLTEEVSQAWMREIHRVLTPGGLFFFSTHGQGLRYKLYPPEMERFDSGAPVVQFSAVEGSNLCAAYYPREWVESSLLNGFEVVELREAHVLDDAERVVLDHDRWLIRKID